MIPGRETLESIEQSIRDVQAQEAEAQTNLEQANGTHTDLLEKRLLAFRELAEVRAKHAIADGVIDQADRLHYQVSTLLVARQKTVAELKDRIAQG